MAARYVSAGREALADRGVWPWVAVPLPPEAGADPEDESASLPERWWCRSDVLAYLVAWYCDATLSS
jgi:hypothetical protein